MSREDDGEPRPEGEFRRDAEPRQEGEFYSESESPPPREPAAAAPAGPQEPPLHGDASAPREPIPSEARTLGMLCHLVALATLVGIPGILCVLVVWLVKRDDHPFVDAQGKEALNFNLTVIIAIAVCFITVVGIPLIFVILVVAIVLPIVAGLKANDGISYRYPLTIRFLK